MKKIPQRMCVVTREKTDKKNLIRVVKDKDGNIFIDETGKQNGKGAYLTKSLEVIEKAKKTKVLNRVLEIEVPDSIYEDLKNIINK